MQHRCTGPIAGSTVVTVSLYDAPSGGTLAWNDTFTTDVSDGYYSVLLGSGTPLDLDVLSVDSLYVGVAVDGYAMNTRQLLVSVPQASRAHRAAELHAAGLNSREGAPASCAAVLGGGQSVGSGLYWIDHNGAPSTDAYLAHCEENTGSRKKRAA